MMPYVSQDVRDKYAGALSELFDMLGYKTPLTPGELNYVITEVILLYLKQKGLSYTICNEVLGVLDAVAREFYRRKVAPYEDEKIVQNGDVY